MHEKDFMKISVVIPAYNYAHFIEKAIGSFLEQNDPNSELIIINDGSTDNLDEVVEKHLKSHPNLYYVKQQNKGLAAARNTGIREAKGDYLLFLDADDRLLPEVLKTFRQFIQTHPTVDVVFAGHTSIDSSGKIRKHPIKSLSNDRMQNFVNYINKKCSFANGASLFHKRVFEKISYVEELRIAEDVSVFSQALALFNCYAISDLVLEVYKHPNSMRNQIDINAEVGLDVVDAVFNPAVLPQEFMKYKAQYYSRRCLSLFRALYIAGRYQEGNEYYIKSIAAHPRNIFLWSHLRKYLLSFTGFSYLKKEYL